MERTEPSPTLRHTGIQGRAGSPPPLRPGLGWFQLIPPGVATQWAAQAPPRSLALSCSQEGPLSPRVAEVGDGPVDAPSAVWEPAPLCPFSLGRKLASVQEEMALLGGHMASPSPDPDWAPGSNHSDVFAGRFPGFLAPCTAWDLVGTGLGGIGLHSPFLFMGTGTILQTKPGPRGLEWGSFLIY